MDGIDWHKFAEEKRHVATVRSAWDFSMLMPSDLVVKKEPEAEVSEWLGTRRVNFAL